MRNHDAAIVSRRDILFSAIGSLGAASVLQGWQDTTFSTDVKVVNVLATVRDKQGKIVQNLTKDDFTLEEDGRPQTIRYFSRETDLPLTLGLLIDTSMSQRRVLGQERTASYRFLDQVLREDKDMAFVIHFDREVELLEDLTSSRKKLESALTSLDTPQPQQRGGGAGGSYPGSGGGGGSRGGRRGGGTMLYDAVLLASDEIMKKQHGRKAVIILSDGVDTGSKVSLTSAIESAQRADTLVYSILFADEQGYGQRGGGFGGGAWDAAVAGIRRVRGTRKTGPTARKSCSRFPRRPAAAFLKFPRSCRSSRSTPAWKRNCVTSTAWVIHQTKQTRDFAGSA
jgi:VWFA-related protein